MFRARSYIWLPGGHSNVRQPRASTFCVLGVSMGMVGEVVELNGYQLPLRSCYVSGFSCYHQDTREVRAKAYLAAFKAQSEAHWNQNSDSRFIDGFYGGCTLVGKTSKCIIQIVDCRQR